MNLCITNPSHKTRPEALETEASLQTPWLKYTDLAPAGPSDGSSDDDLADELFRGFEQGVSCIDICFFQQYRSGIFKAPRQRVLEELSG